MQKMKEILKVTLLSVLVLLLVTILSINSLPMKDIEVLFINVYWFFGILVLNVFGYLLIYLMMNFYLFKKRIIPFNFIFVLLFTIIFYVGAEFFTAENERIDSVVRSFLIVLSSSLVIYYSFKNWIFLKK